MTDLFPEIEPYESGRLEVGDGHSLYWECCGHPDGEPAVVLHGGPGSGCTPRMRRSFDPERYRVVLHDQRGCGRSTPHASDPDADMRHNTTHHLVADLERLREHLGIERWLVSGGSWGSTLAVAYAERFPERVSGMVLLGVTLSRRRDIDWLYRGVGRFFPEEWRHFRDGVRPDERDDLVGAYARAMERTDAREEAARRWLRWEDAVVSLEPNARPNPYSDRPSRDALAFVRICSHYFAHAAWLEEDELIRNAHRLRAIPGVLIHGRLDLGCPLEVAWELARTWPGAVLHAVPDAGHLGSPAMRARLLQAHAGFAYTRAPHGPEASAT